MNTEQPIKTAICSFGMSSRVFHAPFISLSPHFKFTSVLERTKNNAHKLYPNVKVYRDLDELLQDEGIELVIVNTPNFTHYDYTKKALEAGKHVIVEKPFTVKTEEGLELSELAMSKGKVLSVYQNRRFDSDYLTVKKMIESGKLGRLVEVELRFDRYRLAPGPKLHKEIPGPGTGNLYDLGSHLLDQVIQLFGLPQSVFADITIMTDLGKVDDYFEVILFYDRMRVRVHSSYISLKTGAGYVLQGTHGTFMKAKTNIQEDRLSKGEIPNTSDWGEEPRDEYGVLTTSLPDGGIHDEVIVSEKGNYMRYYDGIYRAIRHGEKPPVTAIEGTKVVYIIEKAYESNRLKKIVPIVWKNAQQLSLM